MPRKIYLLLFITLLFSLPGFCQATGSDTVTASFDKTLATDTSLDYSNDL
jgi:hypothetical protein